MSAQQGCPASPWMGRRPGWQAVVWVWLATLAGSCGPAVPPAPAVDSLEAWRAYADALDARLDGLTRDRGNWSSGDATSTYDAWRHRGEVVAIHEEMSLGDHGSRRLRYCLAGGRLRYVREEGRALVRDADGSPVLKPLVREAVIAPGGGVLEGRVVLDGVASSASGLSDGWSEHAAALVASVDAGDGPG